MTLPNWGSNSASASIEHCGRLGRQRARRLVQGRRTTSGICSDLNLKVASVRFSISIGFKSTVVASKEFPWFLSLLGASVGLASFVGACL